MPLIPKLKAYHGSIKRVNFHGVDAARLEPQSSGHLRVHTKETYQAPIRASWSMYTVSDMRPGGTNGSPNLDGLHVHFGHIDNYTNYNIHAVRRDGHAKVDLEHGFRNYERVVWLRDSGIPVRLWRRYLFTLTWELDKVQLLVSNDNEPIETVNIKADLPIHGPHSGHIGFRLDNLTVYLSSLAIREL